MQAQSIAAKVCRRDAWAYRALLLKLATVSQFVADDSKLQFGGLNHGVAVGLSIPCRALFWSLISPKATRYAAASISQLDPERTSPGLRIAGRDIRRGPRALIKAQPGDDVGATAQRNFHGGTKVWSGLHPEIAGSMKDDRATRGSA